LRLGLPRITSDWTGLVREVGAVMIKSVAAVIKGLAGACKAGLPSAAQRRRSSLGAAVVVFIMLADARFGLRVVC